MWRVWRGRKKAPERGLKQRETARGDGVIALRSEETHTDWKPALLACKPLALAADPPSK